MKMNFWWCVVPANAGNLPALDVIDKDVRWIPEWGRDRIHNMVSDRSDWCISRQRVWGVPVPALKCRDCGAHSLTPDRVRSFADKVGESPKRSSIRRSRFSARKFVLLLTRT